MWLEFGVYKGGTIRRIALFRNGTGRRPLVHGFDSFHGLPETWREDQALRPAGLRRGAFSLNGVPPFPEDAVIRWVPGWYNESLRPFLRAHHGQHVSLLHIDSDLYSSASTIFHELGSRRLRPGCVVIFDELFNYREYLEHEMRALWEFLGHSPHLSLEVLGTSTQSVPARPVQANVFQAGAVRLVSRASLLRPTLVERIEARGVSRDDLQAELDVLAASSTSPSGSMPMPGSRSERRERRAAAKASGRSELSGSKRRVVV